MKQHSTVIFVHGCFRLDVDQGSGYFIESAKIDTPEKLIVWLRHLADKNWFTIGMMRDLLDQVAVKHGIKIHGVD